MNSLSDKTVKLWLAIAILFGVAMLAYGHSFLANVAFLVVGALVATVTQLVIESRRRAEQVKDLARSLYEELANRVARCVFDFENPWERWMDKEKCGPHEVDVLRLRKFMPVEPTIYPATAGQIALLGDAAQAVIRFHASLAIYRTDMESIALHCATYERNYVPAGHVAFLAERLKRTLCPGLEALRTLSAHVEGFERIEAEAIRDHDALFKHERSHLTLRQRLEHYCKEVKQW